VQNVRDGNPKNVENRAQVFTWLSLIRCYPDSLHLDSIPGSGCSVVITVKVTRCNKLCNLLLIERCELLLTREAMPLEVYGGFTDAQAAGRVDRRSQVG